MFMPISESFRVCRSCLLNTSFRLGPPYVPFLPIPIQYRHCSSLLSMQKQRDDSNPSPLSFRRTRPVLFPGYSLSLANVRISHRQREALKRILSFLSRGNRTVVSPRKAKRFANRLVSTLYQIDTDLGPRGLNPSVLFNLYDTHDAQLRTVIIKLIGFMGNAKRSIHRDEIILSLLLHFAQHSDRYPLAFQKSVQVFISNRHLPSNNIRRYFLKRNYHAHRIPFTSKQLLQWLIRGIVSTPSLCCHLPLLTRILRLSDTKWTPLRVLHPLIWAYVPRTRDEDFFSLERKYGLQSLLVGRLSYNTLVAQVTHAIRRCDPKKVDIPLIQMFVRHLLQTKRLLYAVLMFDALRENTLGPRLGPEILGNMFERLVRTENFEDASHVYSTFLESQISNVKNSDSRPAEKDDAFEQEHISYVRQHTQLFIDLLRGIRHSHQCQESVTELLMLLPPTLLSTNQPLAAEILRYAAYWTHRPLVQRTLQTVAHPFYDESYHPTPTTSTFSPPNTFTPQLWSAILYAHVQLGLINSSRLILQSMTMNNIPPRPEDMSTIVCGVAQQDLEAGYNLALELFQSVTIEVYETILELALHRDNAEIVEWARGLVAYEGPQESWVRVQKDSGDEEMLNPRVFEMESELSLSLAKAEVPTCTARAKGTILKHVARREGVGKAILGLLRASRMEFGRDVYDGVYEIAVERGEVEYGMWVANEMIERGWIPRNYRGLKARYKEFVTEKRRLKNY